MLLLQSNVLDFVDSPWVVLLSLRSGRGWGGREMGEAGGRREKEVELLYKKGLF